MTIVPFQTASIMSQTTTTSCVYYVEEHTFDQCSSNLASIFYMGYQVSQGIHKNNLFSNTYNKGVITYSKLPSQFFITKSMAYGP